jgi:MoxR-like ATPase
MESPMSIEEISGLARRILDEIERAVVGKRDMLELFLLAVLSDGHVLLDDLPGLAKTLTARSFARVTGLEFRRIQFTPDLMPSDVTGASIYNQKTAEFTFRPGPVFANLLLADEINRAPAKTQSALLEAMQERQVTIEGTTRELPAPFLVIATQNPIEFEGTYPLPEAQLDRFLVRLRVGYPSALEESAIVRARIERAADEVVLESVVDAKVLRGMQAGVERVHVADSLVGYMVDLVAATRTSPRLLVGASPRGTLALMKLSRARAVLHGRDYVVPDDVKSVAVPALAHRLVLRPELWVQRVRAEEVVDDCLATVPTPSAEDALLHGSPGEVPRPAP